MRLALVLSSCACFSPPEVFSLDPPCQLSISFCVLSAYYLSIWGHERSTRTEDRVAWRWWTHLRTLPWIPLKCWLLPSIALPRTKGGKINLQALQSSSTLKNLSNEIGQQFRTLVLRTSASQRQDNQQLTTRKKSHWWPSTPRSIPKLSECGRWFPNCNGGTELGYLSHWHQSKGIYDPFENSYSQTVFKESNTPASVFPSVYLPTKSATVMCME